MTVGEMSDKQKNDIWEKVYHTDSRVSAVETQLGEVSKGVSRIEGHLLNKDQPNLGVWIIFAAGVMFGIAEYISWQLTPLVQAQQEEAANVAALLSFRSNMQYELGVISERRRHHEKDSDEHDEAIKELEIRYEKMNSQGSDVWNAARKLQSPSSP